MEQAIFCGGCFWCTEAVFKRFKGVISLKPGYTGGFIKNPAYREVCSGTTGHAEGVLINYNSEEVSYEDLLEVFFSTHNPTTLNRQGQDLGTQYRSAIFYTSETQKQIAAQYITDLQNSKLFEDPIVTTLEPLDIFYDAEDNHRDYYDQNSNQYYCQFVISPKIKLITQRFKDRLKLK
ncbi:MAG: peptide-methionine (S)-S-oxide reductase MsrA [Bacteroidota bacterium]|nr:peptide-methionine (S)-S-oxide reductase MsrA [Bacteroidota bacterium]